MYKRMKYRIGEMAEFFGLTKEAIRYYERKGIVNSTRDEQTGYRYYERDEITTLKQIRTYESLGFSLEDAQTMVVETTFPDMEERLEDKIRELKKREEAIARMHQELERQQQCIAAYKAGRKSLQMVPETYFWHRVPDEASASTEAEKEKIARERSEEKRWVDAMPPVTLSAMYYDRNLQHAFVFGSTLSREKAEALQLPLSCAVLLPGRLCAVGYAKARLGDPPDISDLLAWTQGQGYRLCGDIYSNICIVYRNEDGERWGVHEFFLPVEKEEEDAVSSSSNADKVNNL
ncbi:MAG: MerR family transcriptional regulator [Clostridia bacterium]|nr:MerR family transcriptional regulator [Clostridia bacterium]